MRPTPATVKGPVEQGHVELGSQTVQKQYIETGEERGKGEEVMRCGYLISIG